MSTTSTNTDISTGTSYTYTVDGKEITIPEEKVKEVVFTLNEEFNKNYQYHKLDYGEENPFNESQYIRQPTYTKPVREKAVKITEIVRQEIQNLCAKSKKYRNYVCHVFDNGSWEIVDSINDKEGSFEKVIIEGRHLAELVLMLNGNANTTPDDDIMF